MSKNRGRIAGYLFAGVPLLVTLSLVGKLIFENVTDQLSLIGFLAFSVFELIWLSFPYIVMLQFFKKQIIPVQKIYLDYIAICIVSATGLLMFMDIRFVHPDPQGPIAIQIIPIIQFGIYGLLSIVINKVRRVPVGSNTSDKSICQKCGMALSDAVSKYCPKCGAKIS